MPALANLKHEQFCQLLVRGTKYGWSIAETYGRAGFRATGHSAEVSASRLMKKAEVRARLDEIAAPAFKKSQITVESLLGELEANIIGATAAQQHGAVNGAIQLMGKLRGLLTDRVEVEVGVGREFKIEELIDQLGGGDAAVALAAVEELHAGVRAELEEHAAAQATMIVDPSSQDDPPDQVDRQALAIWMQPKRNGAR